jgi:hypothetical protein
VSATGNGGTSLVSPGAAAPEQLGEQPALLLDGASARSRVLQADAFATACSIATALVDAAVPGAAGGTRAR